MEVNYGRKRKIGEGAVFVGLENFTGMFKDPKFWQSLKVTFKFCLITIPCYQIVSLFVAFLLAMDIKGMKIFRVVYFLPSIIPTIAATMIWTRIFAQDGILNKRAGLAHGPEYRPLCADDYGTLGRG